MQKPRIVPFMGGYMCTLIEPYSVTGRIAQSGNTPKEAYDRVQEVRRMFLNPYQTAYYEPSCRQFQEGPLDWLFG